MMFLLILAAARREARQHNFRPIGIWRTRVCYHGRAALQSCWPCYDEAAFEAAAAIARAS